MTSISITVGAAEFLFVDKCNISHNDKDGMTTIIITDTIPTNVQSVYDELEGQGTVAELAIFNNGTAETANYTFTSKTIKTATLDSNQEKGQPESYVLRFVVA